MRVLVVLTLIVFAELTAHAKTSAIIESWNTHLYIPAPNELTIRESMRIKILDEDGYRNAIYHDYHNKFRKIKSLRYTVYNAQGEKVKRMTKEDALDIMVNASYEIGDARIVVLDPEYRSYPFTVEIESEIVYNGFLDFPVWMPRYIHDLEVKDATLILECYNDFKYTSRELNGISPPVISVKNNVKTVQWVSGNLPAVIKQQNYKSFAANQGTVHIAPVEFTLDGVPGDFTSWSNFGEWFLKLNEGRDAISASTKEYLESVKKRHNGNVEAIARDVYQYMQRKTRYISIQLGIGGFQTIPSDEVDRTGYGDCKALTNYMKAMLGYLNIRSNYVLVKAERDALDILYDFPSNQFNHVFLAVPLPSDTLWFECTSQTLPPAFIGTFTDDRHVLWVEKNQSKIVRTPSYSAEESIMHRHCTASLKEQGDVVMDLQISQSGMFFDEAMVFQNFKKDRIEKYNYDKFPYKDFTISQFDFKIPDHNKPELDLTYKISVNALGKSLGGKMILPTNLLTTLEKGLDIDVLNRECQVRRPFTIEDHIEVTLPENFRLDVIPDPVREVSEFGTFEMHIERGEGNMMYIHRKATLYKGAYKKDAFDRFYTAIKKIRVLEQNKIVLQSKT